MCSDETARSHPAEAQPGRADACPRPDRSPALGAGAHPQRETGGVNLPPSLMLEDWNPLRLSFGNPIGLGAITGLLIGLLWLLRST